MAGFYVVRDGGQVAKLKLSSGSLAVSSTPTSVNIMESVQSVAQSSDLPDNLQLHSCNLCRKKFTNPANLLAHMKNYHQVDTEHVVEKRNAHQAQPITRVTNPSVSSAYIPNASQSVARGLSTVVGNHSRLSMGRGYTIVPISSVNNNSTSSISSVQESSQNIMSDINASDTGVLNSEQIRQACSLIVEKTPGQFYCLACSLTFNSRENGITHSRRQHLGEKPYTCSCGARFALAHARNQHKKVCHLGDTGIKAVSSSDTSYTEAFMTDFNSEPLYSNTTVTTTNVANKGNLPISFVSPNVVTTSNSRNTQPFFYRNTLEDESLLKGRKNEGSSTVKSVEAMGECILPESPSKFKSVETEYTNRPPVYLRIVERGQFPHIPVKPTMNLDEFIAKDGQLTERQISFANSMFERETLDGRYLYRCKICEQRLTQLNHVKNHIRHVHLKEHYKCLYCNKRFASKNTRDKHRVTSHAGGNGKQTTDYQNPMNHRQASFPSSNEPAGIHPNAVSEYIASYVGRRGDRFECKKCRKQFLSEKNLKSHCRQLHFGRAHQCNSCGLYFEQGLTVHREKCAKIRTDYTYFEDRDESTILTTETLSGKVEHLNSIMTQSIEITGDGKFQCRLCVSENFEKKSLAQAHVFIEHTRSRWIKTCGSQNVDDIYLQFIKVQDDTWSCDKCSAVFKLYDSLSEHKKVCVKNDGVMDDGDNSFPDDQGLSYCDETEEELPFDPMSLCDSEIYVNESAYEVDDNDTPQFKIVGYDGHTEMGSDGLDNMDDDRECIPSIVSVQGSVPSGATINSSNTTTSSLGLSQEQLDQLNVKALQFIKEKGGQYHCIVCNRVSNLRRKLVEHVRRIHLLGESDDHTEEDGTVGIVDGKLGKNAPDHQHRMYCRYCEEYFESIRLRADHERHCSNRSNKEINSGHSNLNPSSILNISRNAIATPQERAMRFIRTDKNEYTCTICNIRVSTQERVITHIRKIHFGDVELESKSKGKKVVSGRTRSNNKVVDPPFKGNGLFKSKSVKPGSSLRTGPLAVRRVPGKPVGNLIMRQQTRSRTSSSSNSMIDEDETMDDDVDSALVEPKMTRSKSRISSTNSKSRAGDDDKDETTSTPSQVESNGDDGQQNETDTLTPAQQEEIKNMIFPWSVGGKYSFSKCKECNMLFTKYTNAEAHVRKNHLNFSPSSAKGSKDSELKPLSGVTGVAEKRSRRESNVDKKGSELPNGEDENGDHGGDYFDSHVSDDDGAAEPPISPWKSRKAAADDVKKKYWPSTKKVTSGGITSATLNPNKNRPYPCLKCDRRFLQNRHLKAHKKYCKGVKEILEDPVQDEKEGEEEEEEVKVPNKEIEDGVLTKEQCDEAETKIVRLTSKSGGNQYKCTICSVVFKGKFSESVRHVRRVHYGEKAFQCEQCKERFKYLKTFQNHKCDGLVKKTLNEEDDRKSTESLSSNSSNSSTKSKSSYRCKFCGELIEDKPFIMYHLVSAHHDKLQSMGMGSSLELMDSMIDEEESESKSVEEKKVTKKKGTQKQVKSLEGKQMKAEEEQELKITSAYSLNPDISSSKRATATVKENSTGTKKKTKNSQSSTSHNVVKTSVDNLKAKVVKVHGSKKEVLKAIAERGYYLTNDGKMETLYPSYVMIEGLRFEGTLPPCIMRAAKELVEKREHGRYRCKRCLKTFASHNGCSSHVCKIHYGLKVQSNVSEAQQRSSSQTSNDTLGKKSNEGENTLVKTEMDLVDLLEVVFNRPVNTTGTITEEEVSMAHSLIQTMRKSTKFACAACDNNDDDLERIRRHAREVHFGQINDSVEMSSRRKSSSISSNSNQQKKEKVIKAVIKKENTAEDVTSGERVVKQRKRKSRPFLTMKKWRKRPRQSELKPSDVKQEVTDISMVKEEQLEENSLCSSQERNEEKDLEGSLN